MSDITEAMINAAALVLDDEQKEGVRPRYFETAKEMLEKALAVAEPVHHIEHPWIIIDQPDGKGPLRTVIAGPPTAGYEEFSLLVCDLIRHIARAKHVPEEDVFLWVEREFFNPTTDLETLWQAPSGRA